MLSRFVLQKAWGSGMFNAAKLCVIQPVRAASNGDPNAPPGLQAEFDPRIRAKILGTKPEHDPNVRGMDPNEYEIAPVNPPYVAIETQVANIKRAHEIFYGPDRDLKNFPIIKQPLEQERFNFLVINQRFCKMLYERIGVSGCYTTFLGTITFFLSKEITPMDHALPEFFLMLIVGVMFYKKFALRIEAFADKHIEKYCKECFEDPIAEANATLDEDIAVYEKDIWRLNAIKPIFQAKRELIDLQMEVEYRERLQEIYQQVKNRLDYQADRDFLERKFEQDHMVNWIVQNVKKSITPQQEKENIASCIQTLKQLSATSV